MTVVTGEGGSHLRALLERTTVREVLMGAQDNLTNVLAVVLGVAIGSGRADLIALAGLSAAIAEAVSMGGVLYSATRADQGRERLARRDGEDQPAATTPLSPALSGLTTFAAAMLAGIVPLLPFIVLPVAPAAFLSVGISLAALFGLGAVTGRISGNVWWRDGVRLITVAGLAALAAALVGSLLQVE
jgi:VIT1/CCC1 family predicted Fe2+/Mn2+ transporter